MIDSANDGSMILHYKIIEELGEVVLRLSFVGQGGPDPRSIYIYRDTYDR